MTRSTAEATAAKDAADLDPAGDPGTGDPGASDPGAADSPAGASYRARVAGWATGLRALDRRWQALLVALVVLAVGAGTWWLVQRDDLPDGAAFRLGETTVTSRDVDRRVDALEALYGVQVPKDKATADTFRRDTAKSMAVQLMLQEEADERGIVIPEKEVDDTLGALVEQRYPDGGHKAFVAALGEEGATEDQVRDEIRDQLLVSKLFDDAVGKVTVGEAELRDVFRERRDDLATPVRRSLANIVVADRSAARRVLALLRKGQPFASVARQYSLDASTRDSGGALGAVARADLEKGYGSAAFSARVGGLFGPVKTQYGWNVGKVERELPARPASYARVRDALRQSVVAERSVAAWRAWLADVIKAHDVRYADDYRPKDPDAVPDVDRAEIANPGSASGE